MEVKAKARFIRMSSRKVRLVVDVVRGMKVGQAQTQLQFMKKAAAEPVLKLLNSAIANAENNFKLNKSELFIKTITADEGPTLDRWRPRAFGKAAPIRKRSTHISIVLDEKGKESTAKPLEMKAKAEKEIVVDKTKKTNESEQTK